MITVITTKLYDTLPLHAMQFAIRNTDAESTYMNGKMAIIITWIVVICAGSIDWNHVESLSLNGCV